MGSRPPHATSIAIEYERPRLQATAVLDGRDFASLLDKAVARTAKVQVIEEKVLEEQEPIKPVLPVPDRRYRR
jgi:hypothetical protein